MKTIILFIISLSTFPFMASSQSLPSNIPSNGLVGWWPFEGNSLDKSGRNHDAQVIGAELTTDRFGSPNKAYLFGQGKYMNVDSSDFMAFGKSSYTISAWFKTSMVGIGNILRYDCIVAPCISEVVILLRLGADSLNATSAGNVQFSEHDGSGTITIASPLKYNDDKWHLVTVVKDTSKMEVTMHIDGVKVTSQKMTRISNVGRVKPLNFGTLHSGSEPFLGAIDDIGVWNRSLNEIEISNLKILLPPNVPSNGLIGWWPFTGNAADSSGNNHHGTVLGAELTDDRFGSFQKAYAFGQGKYINIDSSDFMALGKSPYTISAWFKTEMLSDGNILRYDCVSSPCISEIVILLRIGRDSSNKSSPGNLQFSEHDGTATVTIASPLRYNDGKWHIVTILKDTINMTVTMLVDGENVSSKKLTRISNVGKVKPLNFGALHFNYEPFTGSIDDIGVWKRTLTIEEVKNLNTKPVNTGAVELDLVNNILIYPNPCKEALNITLDDHRFNNQSLGITIMDSYGKLMVQKTIESNKFRIDEVESLNPGIYFIRLTDSNYSISVIKKFVKEDSK
jgi:hypothetical protein